ncbi:RCC1 domain-containing protein, partial [Pseudonocardia lacus]|uniref:RCC1 domain-containing protein n=1 Tax=Pseudonocardia lacus TaxID=2835865 RepID=UPI0038B4E110
GLRGWSAADRAVLRAPGARDEGAASPRPVRIAPGTVHAWLPHPPRPPTAGAVAVPGWDDVVSIASTGRTTAAVHADGTVSAYGLGHHGSLGDGDPQRHHAPIPRPVPGITDARSVHAAGHAFFAIRTDGTVLAWGEGFLARGGVRAGARAEPSPIPLRRPRDVVAIRDGVLHAIALLGTGRVAGWGVNLTGVLGERARTDARVVGGLRGVVDVAAAGGAVVAVRASGRLCAWGNNAHGLLGVEPTGGQTSRPVALTGPTGVLQVAGGRDVALALDDRGAVWAWGRGVHGVLGDGEVTDHVRARPRVVPGLPPARWVGAHGSTGYAVDRDGGLWAWGSAAALGDLACGAAPVPIPVPIPMPGPVLAVSGTHALVGRADQTGAGA